MPTTPPEPAAETPTTPLRWVRVGDQRVRRASQVDRTVLAELADGSGRTFAELPRPRRAGAGPAPWSTAPAIRLLERDRRIVAGAALEVGSPAFEPGRHPWSRLAPPETADLYTSAPPSETLMLLGFVSRPAPDADRCATRLEALTERACQRIGARRLAAFVPFAPPKEGADWRPEAYLQQVYFGAFADPDLAPFLAADFVPRGVASPATYPFDDWRALMVWENARR